MSSPADGYTNYPANPGGPTNFGITLADARNYWNATPCDALPAGVDYYVFYYVVNSGVARSARILQKLVKAPQDDRPGDGCRRQGG